MTSPDFIRNPLCDYPRNNPCFCGSGQKWKRCCMKLMPPFIPRHELADHLKIMEEFGMDVSHLQAVPDDGKLNPVLRVESRPSSFTGVSWWLVLSYKEHSFDEMLPADFMGLPEERQDEIVQPLAEKLRLQLRPIILAEDAEARLTIER